MPKTPAGDAAAAAARPPRRRAADDRLEDLAEQLDELIGLAPDLAQSSQQSARVNAGIHRSLNALNERIESLMVGARTEPKLPVQLQTAIDRLDKRLEALLTVEPVSPQTPPEDERKLADIARSIDTIKGRMDQELEALASERAVAPPEVERKLGEIVSNLETMNKRLEEAERAAATPPAAIAELDAAVAEITMHQSALDGAEPSPDLQRRFAAIHASLEQGRRESQLSELEQQFRTMIDEVHALRRDSVPMEGVESLRREIGDLSDKLSDLAPRRSLEALEGAVDALAHRIDRTGIAGNDNLAQIVDALKLIRQALSEVQPAESFTAVERDLQSLSIKLDALGSKGVDHLTVSRLQSEASEIRQVLANALPSDVLKALVEQIELLVSKFELVATNGDATVRDLVGGLERRIEGLAGRLDNAAQNTPNAEVLTAIGSRIDALQRACERGGRADGGLEPMLQTLADKVDDTQARLVNLDAIEREMNALSSGLRDVRGSVAEAAEHAARSAVRELAADAAAAKPAPEVKTAPVAPTPIAEPASTVAAEQRPPQPAERPAAVDGELPADFPLE